ncbi:RNA polymerase sigma-70 factor [Chitinophagaceae bacterium 26-R-25]|nr:RNA polymerase sigma-70 factor [Chitinophagaceae bacterium 26-R-25]
MKISKLQNISDTVLQEEGQNVIRDVYNANYLALCYFAFKLVNDREEAQDIVMDSFMSLIHKSDLKNSISAKSFLYTAVYNRCIDYIRKQKSKSNYYRHLESANEVFDVSDNKQILIAEVLQAIHQEIENLPEQRRIIFKSIYFEGKRTCTIAEELNISQQTVLNQKAKALQTIKISLLKSGKYDLAVLLAASYILLK